MKRHPVPTLSAIFLLLLASGAASGRAEPAPELAIRLGKAANVSREHDPDHILVKLRQGIDPASTLPAGSRPILARWYEVPVAAGGTAEAALYRKAADPAVELVELDYVVRLLGPVASPEAATLTSSSPKAAFSDDPLSALQWNLVGVQTPEAWELATGAGVTVAVIDSGVSRGPDLACHVLVHEYNALTGQTGPGAAADDNGHGTHVAGTIAQCTNNGLGLAGIAFAADLMPVKVVDQDGQGEVADIARGIDWARGHGADVINMSLGFHCGDEGWPDCSSSVINDAIADAAAADLVMVAATGNANETAVAFPANHPLVLAVGAVDRTANKTHYSTFGAGLGLVAPGGDVLADHDQDGIPDGILQETLSDGSPLCQASAPGFGYCLYQGTSMATPHVAGAAALLRSLLPGATRGQVQAALQHSAADLGMPGIDPVYGAGGLQILDAMVELEELVAGGLEPCLSDVGVLCLQDSRFAVFVAWRTPNGQVGSGQAIPATDDTGAFWFFNPANVELIIKILRGCGINGHFWVFAGGLTNVEVLITVVDTYTGLTRQYRNPPGTPFQPTQDTRAFATCP